MMAFGHLKPTAGPKGKTMVDSNLIFAKNCSLHKVVAWNHAALVMRCLQLSRNVNTEHTKSQTYS